MFENYRYLAPLAEYLSEKNMATVYTPDLRGYGDHAIQKGDIDYIGQHESDLESFIQFTKEKHPQSRLVLAGHSAGGGTVLRSISHTCSQYIDQFLLLAPFVHHSAPTIPKNNEKGYGKALMGRLVPLFILNGFKITNWNHSVVYQNHKPKKKGMALEH
ncbi:alpha/beta hydrolase [Gracilibacillus sp. D59]|uniref:alpha/beta hydrolase n=1 Tax=Gracilibacillus sp. D59 TaxID=3457434 RepID=UPI003FCDF77C